MTSQSGSAPVQPLRTAEATLAADVTMTNANTFYDGPSVSLVAGTWLIVGKVGLFANTTALFTARLWDGTTILDSAETTAAGNNRGPTLPLVGLVAPVATTVYKLSLASSIAGNLISATAYENPSGANWTHILAVRVG